MFPGSYGSSSHGRLDYVSCRDTQTQLYLYRLREEAEALRQKEKADFIKEIAKKMVSNYDLLKKILADSTQQYLNENGTNKFYAFFSVSDIQGVKQLKRASLGDDMSQLVAALEEFISKESSAESDDDSLSSSIFELIVKCFCHDFGKLCNFYRGYFSEDPFKVARFLKDLVDAIKEFEPNKELVEMKNIQRPS